jgi:4-hydroxy-tetrahydrodipicolinate synthase
MATVTGGTLAPLFTPFSERGELVLSAVPAVVKHAAGAGVDGVWILAPSGEGSSLTLQEKRAIVRAAAGAKGTEFLLVHVSGMSQAECLDFSRYAEENGADGLTVLPPPGLKLSDDELFGFYQAVSEAVHIPLTVYQNVGLTGVNFTPALLARLATGLPNFIGAQDSSGNLMLLAEYARLCPPHFLIWNGMDAQGYGALAMGAPGVMGAVAAAAPGLLVEMYRAFRAGDHAAAHFSQNRITILNRAMRLGNSPTITKTMANLLGMGVGPCRPPLRMPEGKVREQVQQALVDAGLLSGK